MKFQNIGIFLGLLLLLTACRGQEIDSIPTTLTSSPRPTNTIQLTLTSTLIPTITVTPTPDACSKQTVPAEALLPELSEVHQNKLIAIGAGSPKNQGEIFITDIDGQNLKDITNHSADDIGLDWSPDGKRISFLSNRNEKDTNKCDGASNDCQYELFTVNPDGTGLRQITKGDTFGYAWSPDGKQIAFFREVKLNLSSPNPDTLFLYDIYIINSDGTNLINLTNSPGSYFGGPLWSPDGKKIAFLSDDVAIHPYSINIINSDGTDFFAYSDSKAYEIVWALDGNALITLMSTPLTNNFSDTDIYKLKTDLTDIERLTFTPNSLKQNLTLSPNGKWLAYHSLSNENNASPPVFCDQIRVINTETLQDYFVYDAQDVGKASIEANMPPNPYYDSLSIQSIQWMPDNRQLLFNQFVTYDVIFGEFKVSFNIKLDGTGLKQFGERSGSHSIQP
jgi:TolB protein